MCIPTNSKILFLDFDGVLYTAFYDAHLEQCGLPSCDESGRPLFDPSCVEYLKKIIEKTYAQIVVSSDWKYYDTLHGLRDMWVLRGMPGNIVDVTPNMKLSHGAEISEWLKRKTGIINYAIIDDLGAENFNSVQLEHLVIVNPYCGVDENVYEHVLKLLNP